MALMCVVALGASSPARAAGQVLSFDDLPNPFLSDIFGVASVPNGYGGFEWVDVEYTKASNYVGNPSGVANGLVSGDNVGIGSGVATTLSLVGGGVFNLNSAYLASVWRDGLQLTVQSYLGGVAGLSKTVTLNTTGSTQVAFDFVGVDAVTFLTTGGTAHAGYGSDTGNFVIDDLATGFDVTSTDPGGNGPGGTDPGPVDLAAVPEPSSLISAAAAVFAGLGYGARRRRRAA